MYKTYQFTDEALNLPVSDLNKNRFLAAIEKQMEVKGFSKSKNPDVLLDIFVKVREEQSATSYTNFTGGYSRYRYRYAMPRATTHTSVRTYVTGTVTLNMIDRERNQVVWQATAEKTLDENGKNREERINKDVAEIFAEYPPK
ncbi:MAG: DUF4136 domain-containing protein [Gammaproteobacteria bacterium]|nr:DUF4136 domain-containing protein [Gammaproteobacteria bacterium]